MGNMCTKGVMLSPRSAKEKERRLLAVHSICMIQDGLSNDNLYTDVFHRE